MLLNNVDSNMISHMKRVAGSSNNVDSNMISTVVEKVMKALKKKYCHNFTGKAFFSFQSSAKDA